MPWQPKLFIRLPQVLYARVRIPVATEIKLNFSSLCSIITLSAHCSVINYCPCNYTHVMYACQSWVYTRIYTTTPSTLQIHLQLLAYCIDTSIAGNARWPLPCAAGERLRSSSNFSASKPPVHCQPIHIHRWPLRNRCWHPGRRRPDRDLSEPHPFCPEAVPPALQTTKWKTLTRSAPNKHSSAAAVSVGDL